jgi:hypothetical protein
MDVTITFTHNQTSITVFAYTTDEDGRALAQQYNFTEYNFTGDLGEFTLKDVGKGIGSAFKTFKLSEGKYVINESNNPIGWILDRILVTGSRNFDIDIDKRTAIIDLVTAESAHVTFKHIKIET